MVIIAAVGRGETEQATIEEAVKLADAFDEPLHVVHVLSRSAFIELERSKVDETGTSGPINDVRSMAKEIAGEAASGTAPNAKLVGIVGDPAEGILNYAKDNNTSYVVVGGRKRSAVGKALFGSVTQSVLLEASQPTITVPISGE